MRTILKLIPLIVVLAVFGLAVSPAQAATGNTACIVDPGSGPVGTVFGIACAGYTPGRISNIYAVEPDGRASGLNIYGFFPTDVKADQNGIVAFLFRTEFPAVFAVPPGDYIFVVQELVPDGGGAVNVRAQVIVHVRSSERPLSGANLAAHSLGFTGTDLWFDITGTGYVPGEGVNSWVTQPPATNCSGLGIDQLTLGTLGTGSSSLWSAPGTVKADANGDIEFLIAFHSSACRGTYTISSRAPGSGIGGEVSFQVTGLATASIGKATLEVFPSPVPAFGSLDVVSGTGFPPDTILNCWFTRPDGRVLGFINLNVKTDSTGSFANLNILDDFPPYTSTEPGTWHVTCATPGRTVLAQTTFDVVGLIADP